MPRQLPPGWTLRLVDLLGARLDEVTETHLDRLVRGGVREDADLNFKEEGYGGGDSGRLDLAGDLAAMGNSRGGLIVIGIRDEKDVAVERTPVELIEGEEARIRQIAASNVAPHLPFDVIQVDSVEQPGRGSYLLVVPPSALRPHAVLKDRDLRYRSRDGTTMRYLRETQGADAYRDRFDVAAGQVGRLDRVMSEGLDAMNLDGNERFSPLRWPRRRPSRFRSPSPASPPSRSGREHGSEESRG